MRGANRLLILVLAGVLMGVGSARAQPAAEESSPEEPQPAADDYAGRAHASLKAGRALEAGEILMAGYKETGDLWALRMAGLAFRRAGHPRLALAAWGHFLCTSPDPRQRLEVRQQIRALKLKKAPPACMGPRPKDLPLHPTPPGALPPAPEKKVVKSSPRARVVALPSPDRDQAEADPSSRAWNFELETGLRMGDSTFGLTWAPGLWSKRKGKGGFGFFLPIFLGDGPGMHASIGVEPRAHFRLGDDLRGELAVGAHSLDGPAESSLSFAAGINLKDAISLRLRNERTHGDRYDDDMDYSTTTLEMTFTGKTGKTITAIEGGLSLLILLIAVAGS
jgi:hypothetical protein